MPKYKIVEKSFRGNGSFPLDMLRYEACWPATSSDAVAIGCDFETRTVTVRTLATQEKPWTIERWRSFGWEPV